MTSLVGNLYAAAGVGRMIYRNGDAFMSVFIVHGVVVLAASALLARKRVVDCEHAHRKSALREKGQTRSDGCQAKRGGGDSFDLRCV